MTHIGKVVAEVDHAALEDGVISNRVRRHGLHGAQGSAPKPNREEYHALVFHRLCISHGRGFPTVSTLLAVCKQKHDLLCTGTGARALKHAQPSLQPNIDVCA